MTGLKPDGIVGSITKTQMAAPVNDGLAHKSSDEDTLGYARQSTVICFVGRSPGYMSDADLLVVIINALDQWSAATGLTFLHATTQAEATMKFFFGLPDNATNMLRFDGPGGELARAVDGCVYFDTAEK